MKRRLLVGLAGMALAMLVAGCGSDKTVIAPTTANLPTVSTIAVTAVGYTDATVDGSISDTGNEYIVAKGVCLSQSPQPDLNDTVYSVGPGSTSFSVVLDQLDPATTYYVRAFATNTDGTAFGDELTFATKALTVPTVSTAVVANITPATAISGGSITDDGGLAIEGRGVCFSQTVDPSTADTCVSEGVGAGDYIALMTGLTAATDYHVRAYASNSLGTAYGNDLTFTTATLNLATVTTATPGVVAYSTATAGGTVVSDNGSAVTGRGICWGTAHDPTTADSCYTDAGGLGTFSTQLTGLVSNTTYYARAFAVNGAGTSYGNEVSLTTLTMVAPVLTTKAISGISSNLAGSGGDISTDGGAAITAKGVCWSLNPGPTLADSCTADGTGGANYNSTLTGLNPLTTYYVRAYATNTLGTSYGNELNFTTTDLVFPGPTVPVVGTSTSSITGATTAASGGYVSSDGGSTVTARGVCWGPSPYPTTADTCSVDGSGLGFFTSTVDGLSGCGNVYYIRAYATNSTGTGYGNQTTVSTGLVPKLTTDAVSNIGFYSATSGGTITDDGGCAITEKGIAWSYLSGPTIGSTHTQEGTGAGAFVSDLTNLYANRTYYVRAYATNSAGTAYGPEEVFTTATPSTPYIGENFAGGIVFYVDGSGLHGLVSATSDQGTAAWGCYGTDILTDTAVGAGATNTAAIVATCGAGTAAQLADSLVLNGYSDWFLPSSGELALLYTNLKVQGLGSLGGFHWSSSQANANNAFVQDLSYGNSMTWPKSSSSVSVRAIRAF